jgi:hypothetical protein
VYPSFSVEDLGSGAFMTPVSGSGIRDGKKSRSGKKISYHISESLVKLYDLNIVKCYVANPYPGSFWTLDPGSGREKFGSGINFQDPQHCPLS